MNNGILQATIAYKTALDGTPLDVNGRPTSETGRPQAIAILEGTENPNPALYEIELYFDAGGFVAGLPTTKLDYESCPVSNFTIDRDYIVLSPENTEEIINVYSTFGWVLASASDDTLTVVDVSPTTGPIGVTAVTLTPGEYFGQGYLYFKENLTGAIKTVYVINTDALGWILETGEWNNLRFWDNNGIWNY